MGRNTLYILCLFFFVGSLLGQTNHEYIDISSGLGISNLYNTSKTLDAKYNSVYSPFFKVGYTQILNSGFGYKLDGGYSVRGGNFEVEDNILSNKYKFHFIDLSLMGIYGLEIIPFNDLSNALIASVGLGFNFSLPITSVAELTINDPNLKEEDIRKIYPFLGKKNPVSEGNIKTLNTALCLELNIKYRVAKHSMINFIFRYDYGLYNLEREKNIPTRTFTRDLFLGIGYTHILHNLITN